MRKSVLTCLCITMIVWTIGCSEQLFAGSDTENGYTLTVSKGRPEYSPNPATVYNDNPANDVKVSFKASIEKKTAKEIEDVSGDVKESYYTVTIGGYESLFVSCKPLYSKAFVTSRTEYSTGKLRDTFYKEVNPVIRSRKPDKKTVTLSVRVVMEDNTELSASETITFVVSLFGITVYSYVGNMLEPPTVTTPYYYAAVNEIYTANVYAKLSQFGHATFEIFADVPLLETLPWYDENYINNPCGFSITGSYLAFFRQIRAYPASHQSPTAPGQLVLGDNAGGTSKDFGLLIDKVVDAKDQAQSIHDNPPVYGLHSYNCVDAALAVASAAGVDLGNCRSDVFLEDTDTDDGFMEEMSLPNELEEKLQ